MEFMGLEEGGELELFSFPTEIPDFSEEILLKARGRGVTVSIEQGNIVSLIEKADKEM